MNQLMQT